MASQFGFDPDAFSLESNPFLQQFSAVDMSQMTAGPFKAMALGQLEFMKFLNRRTRAYMEIPTKLSQCRTPQDVMNAQMSFFQTAFEQHQECAQRMMTVWAHASTGSSAKTGKEKSAHKHDYIVFPEPVKVDAKKRQDISQKPKAA